MAWLSLKTVEVAFYKTGNRQHLLSNHKDTFSFPFRHYPALLNHIPLHQQWYQFPKKPIKGIQLNSVSIYAEQNKILFPTFFQQTLGTYVSLSGTQQGTSFHFCRSVIPFETKSKWIGPSVEDDKLEPYDIILFYDLNQKPIHSTIHLYHGLCISKIGWNGIYIRHLNHILQDFPYLSKMKVSSFHNYPYDSNKIF